MLSSEVTAKPEETKPTGPINGFTTCESDYLLSIAHKLELGADITELLNLQEIFKALGRCPTADELFFALQGLRQYIRLAKSRTLLTDAQLPDNDAKELLSDLVRRYGAHSSTSGCAPTITGLAEYAATGKSVQGDYGITIGKQSYRSFPELYTGASETHITGDLVLTLSRGKTYDKSKHGRICVLISAEDNGYTDEILNRLSSACRRIYTLCKGVAVIPTTEFGLIADINQYLGGASGMLIDTTLLPSPSELAADAFKAPMPSYMILTDRFMLPKIWQIAWEYKLVPKAPVTIREGDITVKYKSGALSLDKKILTLLEAESVPCELQFDKELQGCVESVEEHDILGGEYSLEIFSLCGGNVYSTLEDILNDEGADYAIGGTLDVSGGDVLPLILSLDAYRRNNAPNLYYARFFVGDTTNIRIFKIKAKKVD